MVGRRRSQSVPYRVAGTEKSTHVLSMSDVESIAVTLAVVQPGRISPTLNRFLPINKKLPSIPVSTSGEEFHSSDRTTNVDSAPSAHIAISPGSIDDGPITRGSEKNNAPPSAKTGEGTRFKLTKAHMLTSSDTILASPLSTPYGNFHYPGAARLPPILRGQPGCSIDATAPVTSPPLPPASQHVVYTLRWRRQIAVYSVIDAILVSAWGVRHYAYIAAILPPLLLGTLGAIAYSRRAIAGYLSVLLIMLGVRLYFLIGVPFALWLTIVDSLAFCYEVFLSCPVTHFYRLLGTFGESELRRLMRKPVFGRITRGGHPRNFMKREGTVIS